MAELDPLPRTDSVAPERSGSAQQPTIEEYFELAREARAEGRRGEAAEIVERALRSGHWCTGRLWSELLSLMDVPADYARLRTLWLDAPRACHGSRSILRAVARAASVAGAHDDARALLRKAVIDEARRRRRPRAVLGRAKRRLLAHSPPGLGVVRRVGEPSFAQRAAEALKDFNSILDPLAVRTFLISGTLLGYVRDRELIPWDKDIDLGVLASEVAAEHLVAVFERTQTFSVRRLDFNSDRLRVNHLNGTRIDIFPHYSDETGTLWHDGTATRWWNTAFTLTEIEFLGTHQFIPGYPERYLAENYGNWQVPDPNFDARLDAPNVEITDRPYFETLQYFALLDAVAKDIRSKRARYVILLRQLGERDWLDQL